MTLLFAFGWLTTYLPPSPIHAQAYRKRMIALRPFHDKQRKQLELVQRLQWKGPLAAFQFDASQLQLPPRPKPFRHMPTHQELTVFFERVQLQYYQLMHVVIQEGMSARRAAAMAAAAKAEEEKLAAKRRARQAAAAGAAAASAGKRPGARGGGSTGPTSPRLPQQQQQQPAPATPVAQASTAPAAAPAAAPPATAVKTATLPRKEFAGLPPQGTAAAGKPPIVAGAKR